MRYSVRHRTSYVYGDPVGFARCNLHLTPEHGGGQRLLSFDLAVAPAPHAMVRRREFFGAEVVALTIDAPHSELVIEARSEVEVRRPPPASDDASLPWEEVRRAAFASRDLGARSPVHVLSSSPRVPILAAATAYARPSFPPAMPVLAGARDLMHRMGGDFVFDPRATTVSTPVARVLASRRGVCQDFAHAMIACLRGLGIPAAYVSGYLRTIPPPGRERLRGADASHAWVSVWSGEEWVDLDPTNTVDVRDDHVAVARGRDYGDVSPVDGIIVASGGQRLSVEVDVVPVGGPDSAPSDEEPALARASA